MKAKRSERVHARSEVKRTQGSHRHLDRVEVQMGEGGFGAALHDKVETTQLPELKTVGSKLAVPQLRIGICNTYTCTYVWSTV
jgi:hypothetical protein